MRAKRGPERGGTVGARDDGCSCPDRIAQRRQSGRSAGRCRGYWRRGCRFAGRRRRPGRCLGDQDKGVRQAAAHALGKLGPAAKAAAPALLESLKDTQADVQREAGRCAAYIGSDTKAAIPWLAAAARGSDHEAGKAAVWALAVLGDDGIAATRQLLKDKDAAIRELAAGALGAATPSARHLCRRDRAAQG